LYDLYRLKFSEIAIYVILGIFSNEDDHV